MSNFTKLTLLSNSGPVTSAGVVWPGGIGTFEAVGTWGGGSAKLQSLGPDGTSWSDLLDVVLSANGAIGFEYGQTTLRCVVATATGVYATVCQVSP